MQSPQWEPHNAVPIQKYCVWWHESIGHIPKGGSLFNLFCPCQWLKLTRARREEVGTISIFEKSHSSAFQRARTSLSKHGDSAKNSLVIACGKKSCACGNTDVELTTRKANKRFLMLDRKLHLLKNRNLSQKSFFFRTATLLTTAKTQTMGFFL